MTDNKGNNNNIYIFFIDDEQSKVYLKIPVAKLMIILVIQLVVIQWTM